MRIALIRKAYTPFGGAERHVDRFIDGLLAAGHDVHLYTARWTTTAESPRVGLTLHTVPVVGVSSWTEAWSFGTRASRTASIGGYDVVHSFDRVTSCDVYRAGDGVHREWLQCRRAAQPAWRRAIPSLNPLHRVYLSLERGLFQGRARIIVANSERGRADITRHYGTDAARIRVVYNGVDLDHWRMPSMEERQAARGLAKVEHGQRLAVLIGSGFERKGVATAIRALAALRGKSASAWRLAVVGRGRPEAYRTLARSLGVGDRVSFVGPVPDVRPWYAAADGLLLPTIYDPFANVCLEALACGVPVVTSAANGAAEIILDDAGTVVADASDADGFAAALTRIGEDAGDRAIACRRVAERFPFRKHLDAMLAVYEDLRKQGRTPHSASRRLASPNATLL